MQYLFDNACECDPKKDMDCGLTTCVGGSNGSIVIRPSRRWWPSTREHDPLKQKPKSEGYRPPAWVRGKRK